MINPSWSFADVFALKALQKSMMLTPCCPSAGPTGGAGVALPAGICSFTWPITFFAITSSPSLNAGHPRLQTPLRFLHLQEVELNRRGPSEDRDHHFERVAIRVHFVHDPGEARKRAVDDFH